MAKKNPRKKPKTQRVTVPAVENTYKLGQGFATIHARAANFGNPTLGTTEFVPETRTIEVRLNIGHPGIRAAAMTYDSDLLNAYVSEMCFIGVNLIRDQSGDWPWPHEDWPEVVQAWEEVGRKIRPGEGHDLGKIQ